MPESCIVILDPSEYMRNGDYIPTRYEAQQDAARWLIADITTSSPENTVGVMAGTSVLVSTTNNIGQLFEAVKSSRRKYTGEFEIENSLQVAFMALKHRRNKVGSQRIILFVGSPIMDHKSFPKLSKSLRKNNVSLQIVTLGDEPNQDKLELLIQNNSEDSRMINIPKGTVPSEFLSATSTFGTTNGFAGETSGGGMIDTFDPSMDPELAMALQISLQEEQTRQAQLQQNEEQREATTVEEDSVETSDVAAAPALSQIEADDDYKDEMAMMQQALAMSLQEEEDGRLQTEKEADPSSSSSVEMDNEPVIETKTTDEDSKVEPELVTIQDRAANSFKNDDSSRLGSSPENAISLVDIEESLSDSDDGKQFPSAVAATAAATAATMSSNKPLPPSMIINVEDEQDVQNDVWEDEPKRSFGEEDSATNEVWENEPRVSVVASSIDHYEAEAMLLASPPKSGGDEPKSYDDETKMALMMPATVPRDDNELPPPPSMPPPDVPQTTSSQESNWNQINQALDVYYTASSETNGRLEQHPVLGSNDETATHYRSSSLQSVGSSTLPVIRSCWSNLDQAFDEYNTAINEISTFLPAGGNSMTMPSSVPPAHFASMQRQGEEERQDNVPREEYQKLAAELDEAKKAMAIMHGIVNEKDEMIVALREIMGMMQQERRNLRNEAAPNDGNSETESEREMTDSLIQEIRKKNRNLEGLRMSLANYKTPSTTGEAPAPVSQSLTEKRRKKRELENLRASLSSQKRPTPQN
ncbi:unnamed protein product [Cylindrotheca closterium]|uniref:VWFA domain-containing protein n=1 Tax=Cylindrotheca closterium TaxID=2856 RepID=A0AAD2FE35_9STRA|nr:unnamed protein product [Cylindrotheca closterium]